MNTQKQLLFIALIILGSACKRDNDDPQDPIDTNEEELITTVQLTFSTSNGTSFSTQWQDIDGPGGTSPIIDSIFLDTNTVYKVSAEFLDESGQTTEDITEEIQEESSEHLICFDPSEDNVTIERTDSDGEFEIGISTRWTTSDAANLDIKVSLKHQPDIKDGTCAPGETDVEVTFPLTIK